MTTPTRENRGLLPHGTVLDGLGTITDTSSTAYLVETYTADMRRDSSQWVSFDRVHGAPAPVLVPLVVVR